MNNAFVIWDNSEKGFYESRSEHSIYFTDSIDEAMKFQSLEEAKEESDTFECAVVLQLK